MTCPCPEPDESSPCSAILFLTTHLHFTLLSMPSNKSDLFHPDFPTKTLYAHFFSPTQATCLTHLTLLEMTIPVAPGKYYQP